MKRKTYFLIIIGLTGILMVITGIFLDDHLYYKGYSILNPFSRSLPFNVCPSYIPTSLQKEEFVLFYNSDDKITKNQKISTDTAVFVVNSIVRYGFDDKRIIIKITDSLNNIRWLELAKKSESDTLKIAVIDPPTDQSMRWIEIASTAKKNKWLHPISACILFLPFLIAMIAIKRLILKSTFPFFKDL